MKKILFVCKGNVCRSPAAEAILKHLVPGVITDSAGLTPSFGQWGSKPAKKMRDVFEQYSIPISHRAQPLTQKMIDEYDIVYYMDMKNERKLKKVFGPSLIGNKLQLIGKNEVVDPYGKTFDDFHSCFCTLYMLIYKICLKYYPDELNQNHSLQSLINGKHG